MDFHYRCDIAAQVYSLTNTVANLVTFSIPRELHFTFTIPREIRVFLSSFSKGKNYNRTSCKGITLHITECRAKFFRCLGRAKGFNSFMCRTSNYANCAYQRKSLGGRLCILVHRFDRVEKIQKTFKGKSSAPLNITNIHRRIAICLSSIIYLPKSFAY